MKCLRRNMREFQYYAYTGLSSDLNKDGLHTGVWEPQYEDPVTYKGNISTPGGAAMHTFYGLDINYSHILVMSDPNTDIKETGYIVWNGSRYRITAVRPSLNSFSAALEKCTENNGDQYQEE